MIDLSENNIRQLCAKHYVKHVPSLFCILLDMKIISQEEIPSWISHHSTIRNYIRRGYKSYVEESNEQSKKT